MLQTGANGASSRELQMAPKNRFHAVFFKKIMDSSLHIFTLFPSPFCLKCIEFTARTYKFKNLAAGSLVCSAKTGVNSPYFPSKNLYVPCSLLHIKTLGKPRRLVLLGAFVNKNTSEYTFLVDRVALFFYLF